MSRTIGADWKNTGYKSATAPVFGIECEIEAVTSIPDEIPHWTVTEDGSLRNNGREFISLPLSYENTLGAFRNLHANIRYKPSAFSERTSIHVHLNCQPLSEQEVQTMLYLYALFEEFFFYHVHKDRRNNIHCVPLTDTALPTKYGAELPQLHSIWSKYTALNIRPLATYGTIEFRHMHGHADPELFKIWIKILHNLYDLARKLGKFSVKDLNKPEVVKEWFTAIFGHSPFYPILVEQIPELTFNSSLDLKLSL